MFNVYSGFCYGFIGVVPGVAIGSPGTPSPRVEEVRHLRQHTPPPATSSKNKELPPGYWQAQNKKYESVSIKGVPSWGPSRFLAKLLFDAWSHEQGSIVMSWRKEGLKRALQGFRLNLMVVYRVFGFYCDFLLGLDKNLRFFKAALIEVICGYWVSFVYL